MEKRAEYLFVYGTLRKSFQSSMHQLLAGNADFADKAKFQGKLYDLEGYPGAVCSENASDWVYGDVFLLREPETVFQHLDVYEECTPAHPEPTEFKREVIDVRLQSGHTLKVWIYLYNLPTDGLRLIESGDYAEVLKKPKK
ncbi:gamma-glutamylcyclotransferase [bacterium]|nr:MAG: gamma-glutamylcyclotransferase [bacterium]